MVTPPEPSAVEQGAIDDFRVTLDVFEGPFDLLLQLITRKRLDIPQLSLAEVPAEFIAQMRLFVSYYRILGRRGDTSRYQSSITFTTN